MRRIAVVGAGIVGASVTFRLAQSRAVRVWLIDKSGPANGTTSTSFAWVNANEKTPRDYFELNYAGLEEHFRLRDELPGGAPWLYPGGNLEWAEYDAALEQLSRKVERLRAWGYAAEWRKASGISEAMEPNVAFPSPDTPIAFFPEEAWIDAPRLAKTLIELARQNGAQMRFGFTVQEIETRGGRVAGVRLRSGERLEVDGVVNAAGPGADRVAALLDRPLPLDPSKGLLLRLAVKGTPLRRILHSPRIHLRPDGPGHILVHHRSADEKLGRTTGSEDSLHRELLERARGVVPALQSAEVEGARIGIRPMPKDGFPCVGAVSPMPGYYEAVTHSGVTLGPLVGRLLAREVLTGEPDPLLAPYSPDRFARG